MNHLPLTALLLAILGPSKGAVRYPLVFIEANGQLVLSPCSLRRVWSLRSTGLSESMETSRGCKKVCVLLLCLTTATTCFNPCGARRSMQLFKGPVHARSSMIKHAQKLRVATRFDSAASLLVQKETMDSSNSGPYVSSPFTLPPYDSLGPISLPDYAPPYCIYPPNTPQPPSTAIPTPAGSMPSSTPPPFYYPPPVFPIPNPPPTPTGAVPCPPYFTPIPNPPKILPSPPINTPGTPEGLIPSPPGIIQGPPDSVPSPPEAVPRPPYYEPSPPSYTPSPPTFVPSPTGFVPSPRSIRPPVVYPPPTGPPSPRTSPSSALWCVAKPSVPDPIIQEAMSYACGSGADCDSIQPNGPCFEPNTLFAHASYAFNSYWQRSRVAGGLCSFGGTAILVTMDPSYDGCHFMYE